MDAPNRRTPPPTPVRDPIQWGYWAGWATALTLLALLGVFLWRVYLIWLTLGRGIQ